MPVRVYMESTGIYHLPLYHRLKDAGLDAFVLNPLVTHANKDTNIRKIHNDKLDAKRIALLGLRPDLKTSIIPDDEVAALKALLRDTEVRILDEPLANLDEAAADWIKDLLLSIQNRTLLVVSHRFSETKLGAFSQVLRLKAPA